MAETGLPPLCRFCGGPIAKRSRQIVFGAHQTESFYDGFYCYSTDRPASREDAQRHSNHPMISLRYSGAGTERYVASASFWDGSYIDRFFCKNEHARAFGYVMAKHGKCTQAYLDAGRAQIEAIKAKAAARHG